MLCSLADGVDALIAQGMQVRRVILIGGAARSTAVQRLAPDLFGVPVTVPRPGEYVALGAARQAAWALNAAHGDDRLPAWTRPTDVSYDPKDPESGAGVREAYRRLREALYPAS
jgi:xylulokinase